MHGQHPPPRLQRQEEVVAVNTPVNDECPAPKTLCRTQAKYVCREAFALRRRALCEWCITKGFPRLPPLNGWAVGGCPTGPRLDGIGGARSIAPPHGFPVLCLGLLPGSLLVPPHRRHGGGCGDPGPACGALLHGAGRADASGGSVHREPAGDRVHPAVHLLRQPLPTDARAPATELWLLQCDM